MHQYRPIRPAFTRKGSWILLVLCALAALVAVPAPFAAADPATRYVAPGGSDTDNDCLDSGDPCATIQHAVDEADAGDTVSVAAGSYDAGPFYGAWIEKPLTIQGAQHGAACARDGSNVAAESTLHTASGGFAILSDNVTISGMRIVDVTAGVVVGGAFAIVNNVMVLPGLATGEAGVVTSPGGDGILVSCNTITGTPGPSVSYGVWGRSSGITVEKNVISSMTVGVQVDGCPGDCLVADNAIAGFTAKGIRADADILRNTVQGGTGGNVVSGSGWTVADNVLRSSACPIDPDTLDIETFVDACDVVLFIEPGANDLVIERNTIELTGSEPGRAIALLANNHDITVRNNFIIAGSVRPAVHVQGFTFDIWDHLFVGLDPGSRAILEALLGLIEGFLFPSGGPVEHSGLSFTQNHFSGPAATGLVVEAGVHIGGLHAERNWWGSSTGPSGVGPGTGKIISDPDGLVLFDPWLCTGSDSSPFAGFQPFLGQWQVHPCDTTPPVIQFIPEKLMPNGQWLPYGGEWHSGIVRVRVVCTDSQSGVGFDVTPARFWFELDGVFTVPTNAVEGWRCRDRLGHEAASGPAAPITARVDRRAPNCKVTVNPTSFSRSKAWQTVNVTVSPGAGPSGKAAVWLHSISGKAADRQGWTIGSEDYSGQLRGGGIRQNYTITYAVRDQAGNVGYCSAIVKSN
jgi:hypothetical protein